MSITVSPKTITASMARRAAANKPIINRPVKFLLISFPPLNNMTGFWLDNGLANLGGALVKSGNDVRIRDYGTPDTIKRLTPKAYSVVLSFLYNKIMKRVQNNKAPWLWHILPFKWTMRSLERYRDNKVNSFGSELADYIKKENIDAVGFKLWNGSGIKGSIEMAKIIKKLYPDMPIFGGGPQVDLFLENILKENNNIFDALVYAEGEETIKDLAEYVKGTRSLKDINNLIYYENGKYIKNPIKRIEDLNSLPFPVYDEEHYVAAGMDQKVRKIIIYDESRGCGGNCGFCAQKVKSGALRVKSAENAINEIKMLQTKYGITGFRFAGSSTPPEFVNEFAQGIINEGIKVNYTMFLRIEDAQKADFALWRKSGVKAIFYGVESGSQEVLNKLNKGINIEQIRQAIKKTKDAGIYTVASLIFPTPFETGTSEQETLDLVTSLNVDSSPVQFYGVYPGTPSWNDPSSFNIRFHYNNSKMLQKMMFYPITLFLPLSLWKQLDYDINGDSFKEYTKKTGIIQKKLMGAGISVTMSDDLHIMAEYLNMSDKDFTDLYRWAIITGKTDVIRRALMAINKEHEQKTVE